MEERAIKCWVIADTHFGHENLIDKNFRPKNYEELIIKNLKVIEPQDIIIHLGDITMKKTKLNNEKFINAIPKETRKILCKGNHDNKSTYWYLNNGWSWVSKRMSIKLYGMKILFSHEQNQTKFPIINIHGHTHGNNHRGSLFMNSIEIALEKTGYGPLNLEKILNQYKKENKNKQLYFNFK